VTDQVERPARRRAGIPEVTVARSRLPARAARLAERPHHVSSQALAAAAGVNSAKVRKDLSHLGSYGTRGRRLRGRRARLPDLARARA
jgi:redox-sensing transcriptional repressor